MDKTHIRTEVRRFVARYRLRLARPDSWRTPLVGFCSAHDPLFQELKKVVSPTHALPHDLLASARTVIAFFIPFGRSIVESNQDGRLASRAWAELYIQTNELIRALGEHMRLLLEAAGHESVAPPATHNFDKELLISDWSHRHVAFIAGLGTFGLNNMLITQSGCCGRIGSLVTSLAVHADKRHTLERCLYRYNSSCLLCVDKCVGSALYPDRFDRNNCYAICKENEAFFKDLEKADVCGKCLVGLPCSLADPVGARHKKPNKRMPPTASGRD
ncbi:MAG: epoxyqueuosine reductase [Syntrophaceae bacterium]